MRVKFPRGAWNFKPNELRKEADKVCARALAQSCTARETAEKNGARAPADRPRWGRASVLFFCLVFGLEAGGCWWRLLSFCALPLVRRQGLTAAAQAALEGIAAEFAGRLLTAAAVVAAPHRPALAAVRGAAALCLPPGACAARVGSKGCALCADGAPPPPPPPLRPP